MGLVRKNVARDHVNFDPTKDIDKCNNVLCPDTKTGYYFPNFQSFSGFTD